MHLYEMSIAQIFDLIAKFGNFLQVEITKYSGQCFKEVRLPDAISTDDDLTVARSVKIDFKIDQISKIWKCETVDSHFPAPFLSRRKTWARSGHDFTSEAFGFCSSTLS